MFDENKHIEDCKPYVDKLVSSLKKEGINFCNKDGKLDNVVFTKGDIVHKIAYQCFYRFSGMCVYYKEKPGKKKGQIMVTTVKITTDMYINEYMKSLILHAFKRLEKNESN